MKKLFIALGGAFFVSVTVWLSYGLYKVINTSYLYVEIQAVDPEYMGEYTESKFPNYIQFNLITEVRKSVIEETIVNKKIYRLVGVDGKNLHLQEKKINISYLAQQQRDCPPPCSSPVIGEAKATFEYSEKIDKIQLFDGDKLLVETKVNSEAKL